MQLSLTSVTQLPPINETTAQVQISFTLSGGQATFVQIYAAPAGGGVDTAAVIAVVTVKPSQTSYVVDVSLSAATFFAIYACPRTGSQTSPDDETNGESWELYCAMQYFTTKAKNVAPATLPPPVIVEVTPQPATMSQGNSIKVVWEAGIDYDKYVFGWTQNNIQMQSHDLNISGANGSYTQATTPGDEYSFRVNGGISQTWNYNYSAWSNTMTAWAARNLTHLRQYLSASGVSQPNQSLRSVIPANETLRKFMQL